MQKITPHLWFDRQAEEVANYYISIFKDSKINNISCYGKEGFEIHKMPEDTAMTIAFRLEGEDFLALNGGPVFKFNESISFMVNCQDQEEVDYYWDKLTDGGDPAAQQCGWLKDKFGLSWQIIPVQLEQLLSDPDATKAGWVMNAMLKMKKIDVAGLEAAANQK